MRRLGHRLTFWLLFLATPMVVFAWMFPFVSAKTIGNDYGVYSPQAQIDLMWSVWKGTFPLYMPGFASGHSTAAMTLGQLYHPLSWISSLIPGYWRGHAVECNSLVRILSLGVAHLCLFRLCRRLRIGPLPAFLLTFPVVYNLRMMDSFRYGAALEAYSGMLFVAVAGGYVYLLGASIRSVALLALGTYLLAVSGHPQWLFFGGLIAGLFTLLFPWIARAIDPSLPMLRWTSLAKFAKGISIGFGSGLLVASPYLLTFYFEYLKTNHARAEGGYAWTLANGDSLRGQISNFMFPLHADVHGAFTGSAVFLVAAMFPLAALVRRPPRILWVLYGIAALAFLFALGKETWVHHFMVHHLPLFDVFRVPGRIVIWIPLGMLPLLAWMLRTEERSALYVASIGATVLLAANWLWTKMPLPDVEEFTPHTILGNSIPGCMDSVVLLLSVGTALLLACAAKWPRAFRPLLAISGGIMIVTTSVCLFHGTWKANTRPTASLDQITADRKASVAAHAEPGYGMEMRRVTEYTTHGLKTERELGAIYDHVEQVGSESEIISRLKENAASVFVDSPVPPLHPDSVATEETTDMETLRGGPCLPATGRARPSRPAPHAVKLVYNTSNRWVFDIVAAKDGYFVLGLASLPGFQSKLDGRSTAVVTANALLPAVFIPRGKHQLDFRFVSWPFLVGVTLAITTAWCWFFVRFPRRRRFVSIAGLLFSATLAGVLYLSLYHGPSFRTEYEWHGLDSGEGCISTSLSSRPVVAASATQ